MASNKKYFLLLTLAFSPSIAWGLITWGCAIPRDYFSLQAYFNYPLFSSSYYPPIHRILYFLRALVFLPTLMVIYKKLLPTFNYSHQKFYIHCSTLGITCMLGGLFVEVKFWNYMLDVCLVSPLLEEIIARFVLYEARSQGFKVYALVAILTSLSFGLMHFGL